MSQLKQNQTDRIYEEINGFELRTGKFYDPGEYLNGVRYEIRILNRDPDQIEVLLEQIKEILK